MEFRSNHRTPDHWCLASGVVHFERISSRAQEQDPTSLVPSSTLSPRNPNDSSRNLQRSRCRCLSMEQFVLRYGIIRSILLYRHLLYDCILLLATTSRSTALVFPPWSRRRKLLSNIPRQLCLPRDKTDYRFRKRDYGPSNWIILHGSSTEG